MQAYDEPTVMWRMQRADGLASHAVIGPGPDGAVVAWFMNGRALGYRDFSDWASALRWSDQAAGPELGRGLAPRR